MFGDGRDGDRTLTYADEGTFTRDMYFRNLTLPQDFDTRGWRIFACGQTTLLPSTRRSYSKDSKATR